MDLSAINSYLEHPFATNRISTAGAEHYRQLAEEIMELGRTAATPRPKTGRCRQDIAGTFGRLSSEIATFGSAVCDAEAGLLNELQGSRESA